MPFRQLTEEEKEKYGVPKNPKDICRDHAHDPPMFMVYPPGTNIWVCPSCGHETVVYGHEVWI